MPETSENEINHSHSLNVGISRDSNLYKLEEQYSPGMNQIRESTLKAEKMTTSTKKQPMKSRKKEHTYQSQSQSQPTTKQRQQYI